MKMTLARLLLLLMLAVAAGALGALASDRWTGRISDEGGLHEFVHEELNLTSAQEAQLDTIEEDFALERRRLELSLRVANAELAAAMEDEHEYGPKVSVAIDGVHASMGELQKASIRHVFEMRSLLDERQKRAFDRKVGNALTSAPRD